MRSCRVRPLPGQRTSPVIGPRSDCAGTCSGEALEHLEDNDEDGDGYLNLQEAMGFLATVGMTGPNTAVQLRKIDRDRNGLISLVGLAVGERLSFC